MPSGLSAAHYAWTIPAALTHNLLRAAATCTTSLHLVRRATVRRRTINVPTRLARPQRRPVLHLPAHWPHAEPWKTLWHNVLQT